MTSKPASIERRLASTNFVVSPLISATVSSLGMGKSLKLIGLGAVVSQPPSPALAIS